MPRVAIGRVLPVALVGVLAACAAQSAAAQSQRSGGSGSAQALRQVQQLAQERTALQEENAKLKSELEQAKAKLKDLESTQASLRSRAASADAAIASAKASTSTLEQEVARRKDREAQLVAEFRKTIDSMREIEADRTQQRSIAAAATRDLDRCAQANAELAAISLDVLGRYEHAGFGHALGRAEPFTRLTRTRVENLVDEYRARTEELRVKPPSATAPAPRPGTAAPATAPGAAAPTPPGAATGDAAL